MDDEFPSAEEARDWFMGLPNHSDSLEGMAEMIKLMAVRIVQLEDQMGSVRRTMYGIPKGDAGDREFTKSAVDSTQEKSASAEDISLVQP